MGERTEGGEFIEGFHLRMKGRDFFLTPQNTAICGYPNELADHILHRWGDEKGQVIMMSRWYSGNLYEVLKDREYPEHYTEEVEQYALDGLEQIMGMSLKDLEDDGEWWDYLDE